MEQKQKEDGLKMMRKPFEAHQISKLPKPTKAQTEEVRNDYKKGIRCDICGTWHHPKVVHLDYVGHAALTDRLLDVDPGWSWEPLAADEKGLPALETLARLAYRRPVTEDDLSALREFYERGAAKRGPDGGPPCRRRSPSRAGPRSRGCCCTPRSRRAVPGSRCVSLHHQRKVIGRR